MIPFFVIGTIIAATAATTIVLCTFWEEIKESLKSAFEELNRMGVATIVGVAVAIQKNDFYEGLKVFNKFYHKNDQGKYKQSVITTTISEDEIPEHIRRKLEAANGKEVDITEALENQFS